ncbi:hypothetical protein Mgra_00008429 [Meloidogyne graminicola]|uniref:Uncharacterized protein n=1 Tax=Meloidogyne graminicola TaxID=189291 RepID=A0A8S9ZFT4_9BILA|nr:hypothetical protein Mgra_00008429 [Meloidogyne graminicola]
MSSLLNVENNQNSTVPPGWNDPPPTKEIKQSCLNNRTNLHKLKRPVDPSIKNSNTSEKSLSLTPTNATNNFHQSRSFPQLTRPELLVQGLRTHPGSAFTPTSTGSLLLTENSSLNSTSIGFITDNSLGTIPPPVILPTPNSQLNTQQLKANSSPSMAPNLSHPLTPFIQSIPPVDPSVTPILSHSYQQSLISPFYPPVTNNQTNLINQQNISEMPSVTTLFTGEEAVPSVGQHPMLHRQILSHNAGQQLSQFQLIIENS